MPRFFPGVAVGVAARTAMGVAVGHVAGIITALTSTGVTGTGIRRGRAAAASVGSGFQIGASVSARGGPGEVGEEDLVTFDDDLAWTVVEPAVVAPAEQQSVVGCEFAVVGECLVSVGDIAPGGRGVAAGPRATLVTNL